jgi:hypothetical protein
VLVLDRRADYRVISACKIVAASVLPPVSTASPSFSRSSSFYDILAKAPSLHYLSLSLLPFSDINISFVPPFDLSSSAPLCSITHLSIVNFRISQSVLAAFACVVQVTLALVLEPEENAQMQLQYTPRDIISFISFISTTSTPRTVERFTVTVTNITPDLVQVVAETFPKLTHLSFVWYPEPDIAHGGVEITDASQILVSIYTSLCSLFSPCFSFPVCAVPLCSPFSIYSMNISPHSNLSTILCGLSTSHFALVAVPPSTHMTKSLVPGSFSHLNASQQKTTGPHQPTRYPQRRETPHMWRCTPQVRAYWLGTPTARGTSHPCRVSAWS